MQSIINVKRALGEKRAEKQAFDKEKFFFFLFFVFSYPFINPKSERGFCRT